MYSLMWLSVKARGSPMSSQFDVGGGIELSSNKYWFFKVQDKLIQTWNHRNHSSPPPPVCASNHALDLFCPTSSLLFITWGSSSPQLDTNDSATRKMQDRRYLRLKTCWRFRWKKINCLWNEVHFTNRHSWLSSVSSGSPCAWAALKYKSNTCCQNSTS